MDSSWTAAATALISGAAMAVAVSGVWVVVHIPARLQERFRVPSSWPMTAALCLGLILAALGLDEGFSLRLPVWAASAAMVCGGAFVGMLASSLGEILQVVPVLRQRLHLNDRPAGYRLAMIIGKGTGALLACMASL